MGWAWSQGEQGGRRACAFGAKTAVRGALKINWKKISKLFLLVINLWGYACFSSPFSSLSPLFPFSPCLLRFPHNFFFDHKDVTEARRGTHTSVGHRELVEVKAEA